jgi:hypothetical protein
MEGFFAKCLTEEPNHRTLAYFIIRYRYPQKYVLQILTNMHVSKTMVKVAHGRLSICKAACIATKGVYFIAYGAIKMVFFFSIQCHSTCHDIQNIHYCDPNKNHA